MEGIINDSDNSIEESSASDYIDIDTIDVKPEFGLPIPNELIDKELSDEVKINGVVYEDYKSTYERQGTFSQCSFCLKFFNQEAYGFITQSDNGEMTCFHCLFWVNYSLELRSAVDGVYGKTIHDYILECAEIHNTETCVKRGECLVCDYLDGIPIEGIFGGDELYAVWKSERSVNINDIKIIIKI
jgi:hypothetical protein